LIWPSARTNGATSKTYLAYVFAVAIPGVRLRVAWVRITAAAFAAGVLAVTALPMPAPVSAFRVAPGGTLRWLTTTPTGTGLPAPTGGAQPDLGGLVLS
jgi:hypothetical protein